MKLISFYPGPSRVYSNIPEYLYEAYMDGVLSFNHRSNEFSEILEKTISLLHEKLLVPKDYKVVFFSSATECWEVIAQSLTAQKSFHFYNGDFGKKWMDYAKKLKPKVKGKSFDIEEELPYTYEVEKDTEIICATFCETSNGTQIGNKVIKKLKANNPQCLVAIDATSAMAGTHIDFSNGDVWFASVQKCFGLPAGMSVMILSPDAVKRSKALGENDHYNSLNFVLNNFSKNQTPYTPNIMDVYLLMRTLENSKGAIYINEKLQVRKNDYIDFISRFKDFEFLVKNPDLRSDTVLTIKHKNVEQLKERAMQSSILLGNGYGELKESTIRIANFPAIKRREIDKLKTFFKTHYKSK